MTVLAIQTVLTHPEPTILAVLHGIKEILADDVRLVGVVVNGVSFGNDIF